MANICVYKIQVCGKKNACYALFGSINMLEDKEILEESGTDDEYLLAFKSACKWSVDQYTEQDDSPKAEDIPENEDDAIKYGERYTGVPLSDKSRIFDVEVWCNSIDIDDPVELYNNHYIAGEEQYTEYEDMPKSIEMDEYIEMMDEYNEAMGYAF